MDFNTVTIPNSGVMVLGGIVILMLWQFLSTLTGEWAKKIFKKQDNGSRRKNDDWFIKFIEHHDHLTTEIHDFTMSLIRIADEMAATNKVLSANMLEVAERHKIMMNDLKQIRNLTQGRK